MVFMGITEFWQSGFESKSEDRGIISASRVYFYLLSTFA